MPIDPIGTTTATTTEPLVPPAKDQFGTDTFLNLLVAQLKYQNPMSPSDGTQFLAQTAQFTMVEKLTEMADLTKSLLSDNQALAAASMLGRTVSWADADGVIQSGVVTGATFGTKGASVVVGEQQVALSEIRDVRATEPVALPDTAPADPTDADPTAADPTETTDTAPPPEAPAEGGTPAPTTSPSTPPA